MSTTHVVEWTDPRVEALHTALFAEMVREMTSLRELPGSTTVTSPVEK